MTHLPARSLFAALLLLLPGVALAQDQVRRPGDSMNGHSINGPQMEGTALAAGTLANGAWGQTSTGQAFQSVQTWGGGLIARDGGGAPIAFGQGMAGAVLQGTAVDGNQLTLRIDSVEQGSGGDSDVFFHQVSRQTCGWQMNSAGWWVFTCGWTPLCGTDPTGAPLAAVPLDGQWTYAQGISDATYHYAPGGITFACVGAALEKCAVPLAYKPWLPGRGDLHRACVRMLRADYCGDGSHTIDGTLIHATDAAAINPWPEAQGRVWNLEAGWTPDGATCLSSERQQAMRSLLYSACPALTYGPACPTTGAMGGNTTLQNYCAEDPGNPGQCAPLR